MDNGNKRIVVLSKTGIYIAQYQAEQLKDATDFDIQEANKKIYVLSNSKIYEVDLQ